jgi:hypothetical protein
MIIKISWNYLMVKELLEMDDLILVNFEYDEKSFNFLWNINNNVHRCIKVNANSFFFKLFKNFLDTWSIHQSSYFSFLFYHYS